MFIQREGGRSDLGAVYPYPDLFCRFILRSFPAYFEDNFEIVVSKLSLFSYLIEFIEYSIFVLCSFSSTHFKKIKTNRSIF